MLDGVAGVLELHGASGVNRESMVNYEPSASPLATPDGSEGVGQFATLTR
jgi:hypothetical protein